MDQKALWEKCVDFHGHQCGGLAIGFRTALYAAKLLDLTFSKDEDVVCISENDACSVDAIQVILGCSVGKGNLLFKLRGKQAFSFFNRTTGKSIRLVMKPTPNLDRSQSMDYFLSKDDEDLFFVKETTDTLPIPAKLFQTEICDCCGEPTMESMIRLEGGKKLCLDCYHPYSRFLD